MTCRSTWLLAVLAVLFLAGTVQADLLTTSFDDVIAEVTDRDAALVEPLSKDQKKLKKAYASVLKTVEKAKATTKDDAKSILKITSKLVKTLPDDEALAGLLEAGLDAFRAELDVDLEDAERGLGVVDEENKKLASATKAYDKAVAAGDAEAAVEDLIDRAKLLKKYQSAIDKSWKSSTKALAKQELTAHQTFFLALEDDGGPYVSADTCISCHTDTGTEIMMSGHWNWEGVATNIEGYETEVHGKTDLINNFCIAIGSNEGRCTQCHIGIGWSDDTFDFTDTAAIDCLVCHDTTGTYKKGTTTAGAPDPALDLTTLALSAGEPSRTNCGACHFFAGGGDNVKHGDLASSLFSPTKAMDVHMGTDGQNFDCHDCHTTTNHQVKGMTLHSTDAGMVACTDCHDTETLVGTQHSANHLANVACVTCHIPAFSREISTKVEWYWADAGQDIDPIPTDEFGNNLYDKKKGTFVFAKDVEPTLLWSSGKWNRVIIGENDQYATTPVVLASPVGELDDGVSKIYPFKKMIGNQPADAGNNTMLVPHLFGLKGGMNPYWVAYDWDLALEEGALYNGQTYTGDYEFVDTIMYLPVSHEIAPKEMARDCGDCHGGGIDFTELGYEADPCPPCGG